MCLNCGVGEDSFFFFSVTAPFYLEDSRRERVRERERERKEHMHAGERVPGEDS